MDKTLKHQKNQRGINLVEIIMAMGFGLILLLGGLSIWSMNVKKNTGDTTDPKPVNPAPAPSTLDLTLDLTMPLTIVIVGALAFIGYKFVLPMVKNVISGFKTRKMTIAQRAADWATLLTRKDNLMLEWSKYETDVALMIDYPIMTDYTDPVVHKVIAAMQKIRTAEMMTTDTASTDAADSALQAAVNEFEIAFHTAERYARRYGQERLDPREQRKLSMARTALDIILDGEAPAHEVEAAYKSLRSSLKGIIDLPQRAVAELETHVRKELAAA
jgi:hypothetical protein